MSVKAKPRKTEACEYCGGKHYSEKARERCYVANQGPECECPRYWSVQWYSHSPDCPLRGEFRAQLQPYTAEELAEKERRRGKGAPVRRKA